MFAVLDNEELKKKEVLMNDLLKMLVLFIEYCYGLPSDHAQIRFLQAS